MLLNYRGVRRFIWRGGGLRLILYSIKEGVFFWYAFSVRILGSLIRK